jgi:hypothetical protein
VSVSLETTLDDLAEFGGKIVGIEEVVHTEA